MRLKEKQNVRAQIPTASMADIAFLLIIFFMLTTAFAKEKGLKLMLPEKEEEVKVKKENIMNVFINAKGQVKIGEEEVSLENIKEKVELLLLENDSLIFSLTIDEDCKYNNVIKVFDELRQANATRIAFTPPRKEE
jgi:biopolymer transport protein ExbD